MKKRYFLALAASVVCGMSVEAQVPMKVCQEPQDGLKVQTANPNAVNPLLKKSTSLLRSTDTALPDSVITTDGNGVNIYRNIYKYDENGRKTEMWYNEWDTETSTWSEEQSSYNTYKYDTNGNEIYHYYEGTTEYGWDEQETNNLYDEQNRLLQREIKGKYENILDTYTYDGNQCVYYRTRHVISENNNYLTFEAYTYDDAGNTVKEEIFNFSQLDENNEPMWYLERVNEYTYDSQNRVIDRTDTWYNEDGSLNSTNEQDYVYVNEGASDYEYYQRVIDASGQQTAYMGQKYELKVGNPTQYIYSEQATENGPWKVAQIINYYYPGPLTSNETISDNAEPTFKAYATDGSLVITTTGARAVQVYGIAGACHYNATVNGSATISNLPAGIYVIASEGETMKISVR